MTEKFLEEISLKNPKNKLENKTLETKIENFSIYEGRRPRIMIADLENSHREHDTKILATTLADLGFDIDIEPTNRTPFEIAQDALDNDVHLICLRSTPDKYMKIIPLLQKELLINGRDDILLAIASPISSELKQDLLKLNICEISKDDNYLAFATNLFKCIESSVL